MGRFDNVLHHSDGSEWTLDSCLIFLLFLAALNLRPAILQMYGEVVFLAVVGLMGAILLLGFRARMNPRQNRFLLFSWLLCGFLIGQSILLGTAAYRVFTTVLFIAAGSLTAVYLKEETWHAALRAFVYPTLVFSASYVMTNVLLFAGGFSMSDLTYYVLQLPQPGNRPFYDIRVLLPFSPMVGLGNYQLLGLDFGRAIGYMREPGIFQVVVIMSYFGLDFLELKYTKTYKALLVLCLFFTFSTAGLGAFIASYFYYHFVSKNGGRGKSLKRALAKIFSLLAVIPLAYWFVFTDLKFGLMAKLTYSSGQVRVGQYEAGYNHIMESPLVGVGFSSGVIEGGNLISIAAEVGLIGLILILLVLVAPNVKLFKNRHPVLVLLVPAILTSLLAQPLFDKALLYLALSLVVSYPYPSDPRPFVPSGPKARQVVA
jgi:hypothetical protein